MAAKSLVLVLAALAGSGLVEAKRHHTAAPASAACDTSSVAGRWALFLPVGQFKNPAKHAANPVVSIAYVSTLLFDKAGHGTGWSWGTVNFQPTPEYVTLANFTVTKDCVATLHLTSYTLADPHTLYLDTMVGQPNLGGDVYQFIDTTAGGGSPAVIQAFRAPNSCSNSSLDSEITYTTYGWQKARAGANPQLYVYSGFDTYDAKGGFTTETVAINPPGSGTLGDKGVYNIQADCSIWWTYPGDSKYVGVVLEEGFVYLNQNPGYYETGIGYNGPFYT